MKNYPYHWGGHDNEIKFFWNIKNNMEKEIEKQTKYTIIKDERSCFGPDWCVNGKWLEEGEYLEQDEELIEHILNVLRERIKENNIMVDDLLYCIHYDEWEEDKGESCETCGHHGGGKTTWKF